MAENHVGGAATVWRVAPYLPSGRVIAKTTLLVRRNIESCGDRIAQQPGGGILVDRHLDVLERNVGTGEDRSAALLRAWPCTPATKHKDTKFLCVQACRFLVRVFPLLEGGVVQISEERRRWPEGPDGGLVRPSPAASRQPLPEGPEGEGLLQQVREVH